MSAPEFAADPAGQSWLSFRIGAQLCGAPLIAVSEVVRDGDITPVPGAPADVLGVRHLRGRIVPVLDGCRRLGMPPAVTDRARARVVILVHADQLVGLRVDAVGEFFATGDGELELAAPSRRRDDPVSGTLSWQGDVVTLLDVCRLCRLGGEDADVA